jgi:hypothetical protein
MLTVQQLLTVHLADSNHVSDLYFAIVVELYVEQKCEVHDVNPPVGVTCE